MKTVTLPATCLLLTDHRQVISTENTFTGKREWQERRLVGFNPGVLTVMIRSAMKVILIQGFVLKIVWTSLAVKPNLSILKDLFNVFN